MNILVAASDPMEFTGLLARASVVRRARLPGADWARSIELGKHQLLLMANGAGVQRAAAAIDSALAGFRPHALVSTGFCGAVAPEPGLAEIVVATDVADGPARHAVATPATTARYHSGVVRTIDHIALTAEEKLFWRSTGATAVDMEAAAVAGRAQSLGVPCYCIKAVTDLADETLAIDLNAALRPDGHFDTIRILRFTFRHPVAGVPELLRLRSRSARAANSLGAFLADCRF